MEPLKVGLKVRARFGKKKLGRKERELMLRGSIWQVLHF